MKAKIFIGEPAVAVDLFNKYCEGKALQKDVIVHTVVVQPGTEDMLAEIAILVYHPNHWDKNKEPQK